MTIAVQHACAPDTAPPNDADTLSAPTASPGERPPIRYVIPHVYRHAATSKVAWSVWYGSEKAVSDAADALLKVRSQTLKGVRAMALGNLPKGVNAPPCQILCWYLGVQEYRALVSEAMGPTFARVDLGSRLDTNLAHLVGAEARNKAKHLAKGPGEELATRIVEQLPILKSVFAAGGFFRELALPLLQIGLLQDRVGDGNQRLNQADRYRAEMVLAVLLLQLPLSLAGLVLSTSEALRRLMPDQPAQCAIDSTGEGLDPSKPLAVQIHGDVMAEIVTEARLFTVASRVPGPGVFPLLLDMAESSLMSLQPGENPATIVYDQFCTEIAGPRYKALHALLTQHASEMELDLDTKAFPKDLIGRVLGSCPMSGHAIDLLRGLIEATNADLVPDEFAQRASMQLEKVQILKKQIAELGANVTAAGLLKLADLARDASAELLANRDWFGRELKELAPLVTTWQSFYSDWSEMCARSLPALRKKTGLLTPAPATQVEASTAAPEVSELQGKIKDLEHELAGRVDELAEARREIYGLQAYKDSVAATVRPPRLIADMALIRRVALREVMSPADVLLFIEAAAEGRVVVLDAAWKSVEQYANFPDTVRMMTILNTMVFPYFEALQSGKSDAAARALLGSSYAANESETTTSNRRMRAMREFDYQGRTHYFERHLRIANGTGMDGMRIHFDIIDQKVVIAYVGPHLSCVSDN